MPQIKLLDQQTIDKIAAGEVVDRPSSVVKELVENAIDAGATSVTVEIREGGIDMIRVTDNGCGIEKEQIQTAFLRHSTSKIREITDLLSIHSLGFRGEALSSIAAVSRVELITKTRSSMMGSRYLIEGGKELALEEIGAPDGSTFLVRDLFYNTPARRKFLKTAQTEAGYVSTLMERLALSKPNVSLQFLSNRQVRFRTSGNGNRKDIIYQIYGREITSNLLPIHAEQDGICVEGFIGAPLISRGNRSCETFFVNGRYIESKILSKAVESGYKGFLMQHRFPFCVLSVDMDPARIDVNVHPGKMEIRISGQEALFDLIEKTVREALAAKELIPKVAPGRVKKESKPNYRRAPEPFEQKRIEKEAQPVYSPQQLDKMRSLVRDDSPYERKYKAGSNTEYSDRNKVKQEQHTPESNLQQGSLTETNQQILSSEKKQQQESFSEMQKQSAASDLKQNPAETDLQQNAAADKKQTQPATGLQQDAADSQHNQPGANEQLSFSLLSEEARPKYHIIGQLFETYWLIEYEDKLYIIDQHAAHEKVLYERTMKAWEEKQFSSQLLSPPAVLTFSMAEEQRLTEYQDAFTSIGFEIEPFGEQTYAVRAIPADLYGLDPKELFVSLMDEDLPGGKKAAPRMVAEKVASMSCKAAVKGNQKLSLSEVEQLLDELLTLENPYFCPHGRPVIISMSRYELDRKFKRIV